MPESNNLNHWITAPSAESIERLKAVEAEIERRSRADFEAWVANAGFTTKRNEFRPDEYWHPVVQDHWVVWQAAEAEFKKQYRKLIVEGDI